MKTEVVLALAHRQWVVYVDTACSRTAIDAWEESGLSAHWAEKEVQFAVSGKRVDKTYQLKSGERLEAVRPLQADAKTLRRKRAQQQMEKRP